MNDEIQKMIWEDIDKVDKQILNIYYMGEFEFANELTKKLSEIKALLQKKSDLPLNIIEFPDIDEIQYQFTQIKSEIKTFMESKDNVSKRNKYENKINFIYLDKISTKEMWDILEETVNEWNQYDESNETDLRTKKQIIAKNVFKILEIQIKRGEEIDLKNINSYCSQEDFLEVVRDRLIELAEWKDEDYQQEYLSIARNLEISTLSSPTLWKKITDVDKVKIKKNENKNNEEITLYKPKFNFLESISNKILELFGKTIYTLADVDEKTGEWKNIRQVKGRFPRKFNDDEKKKIVKIEINNNEKVWIYKSDFPNLQELVLGKGVKKVEGSFGLSDNLYDKQLKKVIFGENFREVGNGVFKNCENLEEVVFGKNLEKIGDYAFSNTGLVKVEFPDNFKYLEKGVFNGCTKLEEVKGGKNIISIGKYCFADNFKLKKFRIPNNVKELEEKCFSRVF